MLLNAAKITEGRAALPVAAFVGIVLIAGCSSSIQSPTSAPFFTPGGGNFKSSQTVTIGDANPGAALYCTTDGSVPTISSAVCESPVTVYKTETIKAIAVVPGSEASAVASATFTLSLTAATPSISPGGGTFTSVQTATINDATQGAEIYYTTDGSTPSTSSTRYNGPITVSATETIEAVAVAQGYGVSAVASAAFQINLSAATPAISPAGGTFTSVQGVTMSDSTPGAAIYYTTDGSVPTSSSTLYTGRIQVSSTETINAIALAKGLGASQVATAAFTINLSTATPVFSPAGGTYTAMQFVTIGDSNPNATIYYTIDGSTPTELSTPFTGPITVPVSETIKAIASASGLSDSAVAAAKYVLNLPPTATPLISPGGGSYASVQTVSITDSTPGASIYFTTDGTTPTSASTAFTGPIQVLRTETIKAVAESEGYANSSIATASFKIGAGASSVSGTVSSGSSPIRGATVQLYAAGHTGYGSAATALASTVVTTNASGAFALHYTCPAAPGDLVYLVATGGNAGAGLNPSISLMTALGACENLAGSSPFTINEVTTVASVYALSAFLTTAPNVGVSATNYTGLTNAFNTVNNLVDIGSGYALSITPYYAALGGTPGGSLNSSYVPRSRIDTLANILAACVNTTGGSSGNCGALFSASTPAGHTPPTDTLQAALNIAQHPGDSVAALYGLSSAAALFQPAISSAPTDWTIALTFTGGGLGIAGNPWAGPNITGLAIDGMGNIWASTDIGGNGNGSVVEFDNLGEALSPNSTPDNGYTGGYWPINGQLEWVSDPQSIAIDPAGNVWVGNGQGGSGLGGNAVAELTSGGAGGVAPVSVGGPVNGLAIDAAGNIWSTSGGVNFVSEVNNAGTLLASNNGNYTYNTMGRAAFDLLGNLWAVDAADEALYQLSSAVGSEGNLTQTYADGAQYDVVSDGNGNVFTVDASSAGSITRQSAASAKITNYHYPLPSGAQGITALAVDGGGNIWGAAYSGGAGANTTISSYLVEFSSAGALLSPSAISKGTYGYTGTGGGTETQTILTNSGLGLSVGNHQIPMTGIAVDGSGNIWVANATVMNSCSGASCAEQLVEFVGLAAPVVTPTSVALQNYALGTKP
jgi:hypothetical protein